MKLLFVCEEIDLGLRFRLWQLNSCGNEAHCLLLPKFALYKTPEEEEIIEIEKEKNFLDISDKFEGFSKNLKLKKLFEKLEKYDSVNIYKCASSVAPLLDSIFKISKSYFLTVNDEKIEKSRQISKLFDKANCILFNKEEELERFEVRFGYDEKTLMAIGGNHLFTVIDKVSEKEIDKFIQFLNIDIEKNLVYCDLGKNLNMQIDFIDNLLKLPYKQLKSTTFIFDSKSSSLVDKERLLEYLEDKNFDFLLPDSLLSNEQKAILLIISKKCITLPASNDYDTLYPALYCKSHVYFYEDEVNCIFFKQRDIFIDIFENFENSLTFNSDSYHLVDELLKKNREVVTNMYHPDFSLKNYLGILEVV